MFTGLGTNKGIRLSLQGCRVERKVEGSCLVHKKVGRNPRIFQCRRTSLHLEGPKAGSGMGSCFRSISWTRAWHPHLDFIKHFWQKQFQYLTLEVVQLLYKRCSRRGFIKLALNCSPTVKNRAGSFHQRKEFSLRAFWPLTTRQWWG